MTSTKTNKKAQAPKKTNRTKRTNNSYSDADKKAFVASVNAAPHGTKTEVKAAFAKANQITLSSANVMYSTWNTNGSPAKSAKAANPLRGLASVQSRKAQLAANVESAKSRHDEAVQAYSAFIAELQEIAASI